MNFRNAFYAPVLVVLALLVAACGTAPSTPAPVVTAGASPQVAVRPIKIGLALGGGAARGFAHVGVIQALQEAGIRPDLVVGTSAGSLVAALYASGMDGARLQQVAESMEEAAFTDWTLPLFSRGMFRGDALARFVNGQLNNRLVEDMPMPLGIVATDLQNGQGMLFRRGDTGQVVRASSAVPAVFVPVRINNREYVDGGLVAPVPVRYARQMGADLVIAVDISASTEGNLAADTLQLLLQTFAIMGRSINSYELNDADVVVRPALAGVSGADFRSRARAIEAGRVAMRQAIGPLKAAIEAKATTPVR